MPVEPARRSPVTVLGERNYPNRVTSSAAVASSRTTIPLEDKLDQLFPRPRRPAGTRQTLRAPLFWLHWTEYVCTG